MKKMLLCLVVLLALVAPQFATAAPLNYAPTIAPANDTANDISHLQWVTVEKAWPDLRDDARVFYQNWLNEAETVVQVDYYNLNGNFTKVEIVGPEVGMTSLGVDLEICVPDFEDLLKYEPLRPYDPYETMFPTTSPFNGRNPSQYFQEITQYHNYGWDYPTDLQEGYAVVPTFLAPPSFVKIVVKTRLAFVVEDLPDHHRVEWPVWCFRQRPGGNGEVEVWQRNILIEGAFANTLLEIQHGNWVEDDYYEKVWGYLFVVGGQAKSGVFFQIYPGDKHRIRAYYQHNIAGDTAYRLEGMEWFPNGGALGIVRKLYSTQDPGVTTP